MTRPSDRRSKGGEFLALRLSLLALLALAARASAHDFTDRNVKDLQNAVEVWIGPEQVYVDYWFLYGEIEALGFRKQMDGDGDGRISPAERQAWLDVRKVRVEEWGFLVDLDGKDANPRLRILSDPLLDTTVDVVGAVPFKMCFEATIPTADLAPGEHTLRFGARNCEERPADQVIVVTVDQCEVVGGVPDGAQRFAPGTAPYPGAPEQVSKVFAVSWKTGSSELKAPLFLRFRKPEGYATPADPRAGRTSPVEGDKGQEGLLKALTAERLTLGVVVAALALAFLWGMGHGLAPGHGKTIAAAYLVGDRGTVGHAVVLGTVVTITHLASVVAMCVVLNWALARARGTEYRDKVNFWSGVASGGITFLVGAGLLASRLRGGGRSAGEHVEDHHDHEHEHEHEHVHDHEQGHRHLPAGEGPPSLWGIVSLGISGGVVPCPTAWVLLLLSIQVDRFEWGLLLILAFSLGLALTLVGIGVLLVTAKRAVDRLGRGAGVLRALAIASPVLIMGLGVVLTWKVIAWRYGA